MLETVILISVFGVVFVLLALKTFEMAYQTGAVVAVPDPSHHRRPWPIAPRLCRLHLGFVFRLPLLVLLMSLILFHPRFPVTLSVTGAVLTLVALWVQLADALFARLIFGYSDIAFRQVSWATIQPANIPVPNRRDGAKRLVLFLWAWATTIIIGYAGIYAAVYRVDPTQFSNHVKGGFDLFYFSVVTFATVGYGDIHPENWVAQLLSISEIFIGMGSLVVLVLAYSLTGGDNPPESAFTGQGAKKSEPSAVQDGAQTPTSTAIDDRPICEKPAS